MDHPIRSSPVQPQGGSQFRVVGCQWWMIRSDQARCRLSDRSPCDRRSDPLGWSWRRSRSASPAGPHDGPHELTCHHDAPGRQRLPIQIQSAQVRVSWTSVHSSTKTPHEQKRDPESSGQRSTTPFRRAGTPVPPGIAILASIRQLETAVPSCRAAHLDRFAQPGPDLVELIQDHHSSRANSDKPAPHRLGPYLIGQETRSG